MVPFLQNSRFAEEAWLVSLRRCVVASARILPSALLRLVKLPLVEVREPFLRAQKNLRKGGIFGALKKTRTSTTKTVTST